MISNFNSTNSVSSTIGPVIYSSSSNSTIQNLNTGGVTQFVSGMQFNF